MDNLTFNPAKSKKLANWNQSVDCCQWNGVACNKGRVIGLDLSEEFITEGIDNSSLFNLQHLQHLNLAYNDFGCLIPSKFGMLKRLRYLNLSNTGFEGQIPYEISHLRKMSILDLSTSFASKHALKLEKPNIGMLMQNLTKITELYLDGVRSWRLGYSKHVEDLLYKIFPQLDFVYEHRGGQRYRILRWRPS
ncbi:LRR receptor serine/threonine-protein kinase EFR [Spatholobus suberectus]|nr:LRR receptor serine/threonine-protein kinase EFR [Spatholobus suberectus]